MGGKSTLSSDESGKREAERSDGFGRGENKLRAISGCHGVDERVAVQAVGMKTGRASEIRKKDEMRLAFHTYRRP